MRLKLVVPILLLLLALKVAAQPGPKQIDGVVAVIGESMILQSEIEEEFQEVLSNGSDVTKNTRCEVFETLLFNKLLLSQAIEDSLYPAESQIQDEIDRRLRYFIQQFGSVDRLEEFYEKTVDEIKIEFHDPIRDQLMIQSMQQNISGQVEVSPKEVRTFFDNIPKDSLPEINAQFEISQILRKPPVSEQQREIVINKLEGIRERIIGGEDFGTLAYLYSEDPGSARQNGELGFMSRGELVPEFAAVAFSLEKDEVSTIVKTDFGYHIIKLIERKGQQVNVRHILMSPKIQSSDMKTAKEFLDSIKININKYDSLPFENAAILYSEDKESRNNGGLMTNPMTGSSKFEMDQISQVDPSLYLIMDKLEVDKIVGPEVTQLRDGSRAYRLVKLNSVTDAHIASLKQDYQLIQNMAMANKQGEVTNEWIKKKVSNFFIRVDDSFKTCEFKYNWIAVIEDTKNTEK